jgi:hypothetical protein
MKTMILLSFLTIASCSRNTQTPPVNLVPPVHVGFERGLPLPVLASDLTPPPSTVSPEILVPTPDLSEVPDASAPPDLAENVSDLATASPDLTTPSPDMTQGCLDTDPLHGKGIGYCTAQQK